MLTLKLRRAVVQCLPAIGDGLIDRNRSIMSPRMRNSSLEQLVHGPWTRIWTGFPVKNLSPK
jgi:hypothetical protein